MILENIQHALSRPFDVKKISWRVGATNKDKTKGIALAYIDARDVMYRLDEVFGLDWQNKYTHAETKTVCEIGALIDGAWIWRAGGAGDTDIEAEKGAISDAFKRAAVLFGIGRYLYDLPNTWVEIDEWKKLQSIPALPTWATPEGYDAIINKRKEVKSRDELTEVYKQVIKEVVQDAEAHAVVVEDSRKMALSFEVKNID